MPPGERALGLLIVGIPALIGLRFPWESGYFLLPLGVLVLFVYIAAMIALGRAESPLKSGGRLLVFLILGLFVTVFVASTFGADPTGRYFLPLALPLGILLGSLAYQLRETAVPALLPLALVALVIGYQALGQIAAARSETGFTTQFDLVSHLPNTYDNALIAFLEDHDLTRGYSSYWVAFRMAFLSDERLEYSSSLPYKADLSYNAADKRYAPYENAVAAADRVAFITANLPPLDARLETMFSAQGLSYQQAEIGPYHIYYEFSPARPQLEVQSP